MPERMTITMPTEMAEILRQAVAGGEYASTSEVAVSYTHLI